MGILRSALACSVASSYMNTWLGVNGEGGVSEIGNESCYWWEPHLALFWRRDSMPPAACAGVEGK